MAGNSRRLLASSQRRRFTPHDCRRRQQVRFAVACIINTYYTSPYRAAFLSFCNHSESRCLFVHLVRAEGGDGEVIQVSSSPPPHLNNKAMVFLKCSHASKLSRENLSQDVIYTGIMYGSATCTMKYITL